MHILSLIGFCFYNHLSFFWTCLLGTHCLTSRPCSWVSFWLQFLHLTLCLVHLHTIHIYILNRCFLLSFAAESKIYTEPWYSDDCCINLYGHLVYYSKVLYLYSSVFHIMLELLWWQKLCLLCQGPVLTKISLPRVGSSESEI